MSEAIRCFHCSGIGYLVHESEDDDLIEDCPRCKGSGGLNLGGKLGDEGYPYVPVPHGVN